MSIKHDIERRANEKMAGIMDSINGLIGNEGTLSTPLMSMGGAALGGMAGRGMGMGPIGMGVGALLGGGMAGIGSNAINKQNMMQNNMDMAMVNGISAGLNANDQTDMMQNQAIMQTNDTVNQMAGMLGELFGGGMGMGGGMDMGMGGMDPAMAGPPPSEPMTDQTDNNGLGSEKEGSLNSFEQDVVKVACAKLSRLA
jgi:hypothetical protein